MYNAIVAQAPNIPETAAMHNYIYQTYIDQNAAIFPCISWNAFGIENRTTNICEGFHHALKHGIMVKHPTLLRLIELLQSIEATNERAIAQITSGAQPTRKKPKYVLVNEALKCLLENTFCRGIPNVQNVMLYVDSVAHQLWDVKH